MVNHIHLLSTVCPSVVSLPIQPSRLVQAKRRVEAHTSKGIEGSGANGRCVIRS